MRHLFLLASILLAAGEEDAALNPPEPVAMTPEILGHYCQMNIAEHDGPKGQIHLEGYPDPIFFGQVRDAIAYLREPEQTARVTAAFVSDMSKAESWARPGEENWIAIVDAHFVVGSTALGGMGAPELVPFGQVQDAEAFAVTNGGTILKLSEIPDAAVLGAIERVSSAEHEGHGS